MPSPNNRFSRSTFTPAFFQGILIGMFLLGLANGIQAQETCNSCSDCSTKLSNPGVQIMLTQDLGPIAGTCITVNAQDVQLDCAGHTITGNDTGTGIVNHGFNNVTIRNCKITHFDFGIDLQDLSGNTLLNNQITYLDLIGIYLLNANNNILIQNTILYSSREGISIYNSTGNRLEFNPTTIFKSK